MDDTVKRFTLRNTIEGGGWYINAIETDIRAYCHAKRLEIDVFKTGWLFKHMSFVISGRATPSEVYGFRDDLAKILQRYE